MPVAAHRAQLVQFQSRERLSIQGEVAQREAPEGLYADGWTNGNMSFTIEAPCTIGGLTVTGTVPDWWPEDTFIAVDVDGEKYAEIAAEPGNFEIACDVRIPQGRRANIRVRTSMTVHDPDRDRHLGVYVSQLSFRRSAVLPEFQCNICSAGQNIFDPVLDPEGSLCRGCASNIRQRAVARLVGETLFGEALPIDRFPFSDACGIGISDSPGFAAHLGRALFRYRNSQFDNALITPLAPYADIKAPPKELVGSADFVTCSEVLEHVEPPIQAAFDGLFSLLRRGGVLILTVPYTLRKTIEHFPDLDVWRLEQHSGSRILINRTRQGAIQRFEDLRFHGGGEEVLEMRIFGLEDIFVHLERAGFIDIRVREENELNYGIFFKYNWGLPITARRPA
jgi:SAM-dependent methyltransferase